MPKRIQRSRAKGWRMPENSVYVGRPSKFGNPFHVGDSVKASADAATAVCFSAAQAVDAYRAIISRPEMASFRSYVVQELRGKDLACWCPIGSPCHADVLLEIANGFVCEES